MNRQVIVSRCLICKKVTGCFDSTREPKRKYCKGCTDNCPAQTQPDSHGFCEEHFNGEMERIRARKLKGMKP